VSLVGESLVWAWMKDRESGVQGEKLTDQLMHDEDWGCDEWTGDSKQTEAVEGHDVR
jgi:hypothetical protein